MGNTLKNGASVKLCFTNCYLAQVIYFSVFNLLKNQNQRYEVRMDFRINGIKPIKALPGYECFRAFPAPYQGDLKT